MSDDIREGPRSSAYGCAGCDGIFDLVTDQLILVGDAAQREIRAGSAAGDPRGSIVDPGRFCPWCVDQEALARGRLVDDVIEERRASGRARGFPRRDATSICLDDILGIRAIDGAVSAPIRFLRGHEEEDDEEEEDHDEVDHDPADHDAMDVARDDAGDRWEDQHNVWGTALLVRIDGVLHALWADYVQLLIPVADDHASLEVIGVEHPRTAFAVDPAAGGSIPAAPAIPGFGIARIDSPLWPFRRDGEAGRRAIQASGDPMVVNIVRRPTDDLVYGGIAAMNERTGMIVLEVGIEWYSYACHDQLVVIPISSARPIASGESATITTRPTQLPVRCTRMVVGGTPGDWIINDIQIGGRSQLAGNGIPGEMFGSGSIDSFISMETINPQMDVSLHVTYVGSTPGGATFIAGMITKAISPAMRRARRFFSRWTPEGRHETWLDQRQCQDLDPAVDDAMPASAP